jgi:hypothetical protein
VITEIPQLISCFISEKSENTSDHAAAPLALLCAQGAPVPVARLGSQSMDGEYDFLRMVTRENGGALSDGTSVRSWGFRIMAA